MVGVVDAETEIEVFCPKDVRIWEESCHEVEFANFTAVTERNEMSLIEVCRETHRESEGDSVVVWTDVALTDVAIDRR